MEKLSVKQKIYTTLIVNKNGYLSIEEIAERTYKDAYMKETRVHLNGLIKRNMTHAIAMLNEDGYFVVVKREPTKNAVKLSYCKVLGYKIATPEDISDVTDDIDASFERKQLFSESHNNRIGLAQDNSLLIN